MPATIIMNPPPGTSPSLLHMPGQAITPNADGTYTVPAEQMHTLIAFGWQIVITGSPPTHVP